MHLVVHPQLVVRRDVTGVLQEILDIDAVGKGEFGQHAESWMHVEIDRESSDEAREAIAAALLRVLERRARRGRGLAQDEGRVRPDRRRARRRAAARRQRRGGRRAPTACWSGWPPTTSPSSATASTPCCARTATTCCARCRAPGSGSCATTSRASGSFGRLTAEARAKARDHQLLIITKANSPRDGPPLDLPRLRRRQDLRRERRGHGRAALPRPVHLRGLHRVGAAGADHRARRSPRCPGAVRLHRRQPLRQGPARDPRDLPARRAVPDRRRPAVRHRDRGAAPAGAAQDPAVPAQGRVRPLHVLPRLPPPRPLHHRRAPEDGEHPAHRVRRRQRRLHHAGVRVGAGPAALRRPGRGRASRSPTSTRPSCERLLVDATRTWDEDLAEAAAQRVRRGGRRAADRALRQGLPRGLQGGLQPPRGASSTCATSRRSSATTRSG